jgi:hypothetical protein
MICTAPYVMVLMRQIHYKDKWEGVGPWKSRPWHNPFKDNCSWSGLLFDLGRKDFVRMLAKDVEEAEELRMEKVKEAEKSALSGKKSRRQRKMLKEQRLEGRGRVSYPSFAARRESRSR